MTTPKIEDRVIAEQQDDVDEAAESPEDSLDDSVDAAPGDDGRSLRQRLPRIALVTVAALVMITGLFAWWQTAHDDDTARAETRDAVLIVARQHIETLNSLDYRDVDAGLESWLAVTTGTLKDQLATVGDDERTLLADQKKISTGKVIEAAVLDLDDTSATVVASVEITVNDDATPGSEPTIKRNRFSADLVLVKGQWKLENLQQVAVSLS